MGISLEKVFTRLLTIEYLQRMEKESILCLCTDYDEIARLINDNLNNGAYLEIESDFLNQKIEFAVISAIRFTEGRLVYESDNNNFRYAFPVQLEDITII